MVHYSKVINGAVNYIDTEIVSQMNGSLKGWGLGIVTGLMAKRAEQLFAGLRENALIVSLGVVDGEMIDKRPSTQKLSGRRREALLQLICR